MVTELAVTSPEELDPPYILPIVSGESLEITESEITTWLFSTFPDSPEPPDTRFIEPLELLLIITVLLEIFPAPLPTPPLMFTPTSLPILFLWENCDSLIVTVLLNTSPSPLLYPPLNNCPPVILVNVTLLLYTLPFCCSAYPPYTFFPVRVPLDIVTELSAASPSILLPP